MLTKHYVVEWKGANVGWAVYGSAPTLDAARKLRKAMLTDDFFKTRHSRIVEFVQIVVE